MKGTKQGESQPVVEAVKAKPLKQAKERVRPCSEVRACANVCFAMTGGDLTRIDGVDVMTAPP